MNTCMLLTRPTEVKGFAFKSFLTAVETLRGPASRNAVLAQLPPAMRARLDSGEIVPGGWYPTAWYGALHTAAQKALGGRNLARDIGRVSTEHDANTVVRFILALLSPRLLFRYADKIWSSYYRNARIVTDFASDTVTVRMTGYGITPLMWQEIEGGAGALLRLCRDVHDGTVERVSGGEDGNTMVLRLSWKAASRAA